MTPESRKKYGELRALLGIDLLRIDLEVSTAAQRIQEASEFSIAAADEEAAARSALEIITAEAAARLRIPEQGGRPKSETQIEKELPLEEDVQAAKLALSQAHTDSALWRSLVSNLMEKSHNLRKACDLVAAGFITPSSYSPRRAELRSRAP